MSDMDLKVLGMKATFNIFYVLIIYGFRKFLGVQTNARQKQKFRVQYFKQIFENDSLNFL